MKLVLSAAAPAESLYVEGPNAQEFPRTVSRLAEMRSHDYMALAHASAGLNPRSRCLKETPVQTFKAYRTFENDKVVSSRFVDTTLDELDPGEVVVRTKYSTINYKDALSHNGAGRIMRKYPTVAGIDMAGTVESLDRRALEARRQGDRPRLRPRRRARRRLQRARARARATGSCAGRRA